MYEATQTDIGSQLVRIQTDASWLNPLPQQADSARQIKTNLFKKRQMQFASQIPEVCELLYIAISWMVGSEHQS